jgi:desulfoferrodoxin
MNIIYTCDDNFAWLMGISMISLFENNTGIKNLEVFLISDNISKENKQKLNDIADKYSRDLNIIEMPELNIPDVLCNERWPKAAFARLFSAELLPETIDRALYLDCDTIVCGDISELEKYDMNGNLFCGVRDCISRFYRKNIGLDESDIYVNTGVLLLDIAQLRDMDIRPYLEETANKYKNNHYIKENKTMKETKFYICEHCGNIIEKHFDSGVRVVCCGEKMKQLEAGVTEASREKHIPVVECDGKVVRVTVGSVLHPMTAEHSILWVTLETDKGVHRKNLSVDGAPEVIFTLADEKPVAVYAYCNLHGLWKKEI